MQSRGRYGLYVVLVISMLVIISALFLVREDKPELPKDKRVSPLQSGHSGDSIRTGVLQPTDYEAGQIQAVEKAAPFLPVTAIDAVAQIGVGWNLGNQLDAMPGEGDWGNGIVDASVFDEVKAAGFDLVRIPVSWNDHIGAAPDYKIDIVWMDRVEEVVDWALERDMWVMLNVHHDSWKYMNLDKQADPDESMRKFMKVWEQIAQRFSGKSEKLMLETLNEPTDMDPSRLDELNEQILQLIRSSGGNNKERLVVEPGLHTNMNETIRTFKKPNDPYVILTVHNYEPWDYVANWWGHITWGTDSDKAYFDKMFKRLHDKFVADGQPIIIGEFGTLGTNERHSKWLYHDYFVRTAKKYGIVSVWWDNGEHLDRLRGSWNDPVMKDIIVNASRGIANSFVETGDLYIRQSMAQDTVLQLELNGNALVGIYNGDSPLGQDDYTYDEDQAKVTIKQAYLEGMLRDKELGDIGQLTFRFSQGADQIVHVHQYTDPVLEQKELVIDRSGGDIVSDVEIGLAFNGTELARLKAVEADGQPVHTEWKDKQYVNLSDDYSFDANRVYLKARFANMFDKDATITLEFWPSGVQLEVPVKVIDKQ
ncbi:endoglucanase [Paenibacillus cellulosilyticus]|uniref:Endoglucanase n=1 Tax=Paenibacillus cellulosilyticus TaxID=375489 RepID=A0A2V2Z8U3_9BACL|nr:cellulase family glycosylhydrolase [Paenibacillus cellulosilyticus]PWW08541.1 endoglucanase [Paenibacillus cellulosilyticus]QKS48118.1 cellulase family glycosylhydrolase [Paenibacillus cellulosilyticus]